jgi:hypothetical protein
MARAQRNRPRWLLVAFLLTVLVLVVNIALSSQSSGPARRLAKLGWLDAMRSQIERSTAQGGDIEQVRADAARLGRAGVARRLEKVVAEAAAVRQAALGQQPPDELASAHSLLVSTMTIRARAAGRVRDALTLALGTGAPEPAADALAEAGRDLLAADRTYEVFLELLAASERTTTNGLGAGAPPSTSTPPPAADPNTAPPTTSKPPPATTLLPESRWVADPDSWSSLATTVLVRTLRASATLAPVHDVSVLVVTTDPAAVGQDGGAMVLPMVKDLQVEIVIANTGNEPEKRVSVLLALDGGAGKDTAREFVDLIPGQRRSISLTLHPMPGAPGTLSVTVGPVPGETTATDNMKIIGVLFR